MKKDTIKSSCRGTGLLVFCLVVLLAFDIAVARSISDICSGWEFVKTDIQVSEAKDDQLSWEDVTIPHTWNDKDAQSGGEYYTGTGCYRKKLFVDEAQKDKRFFLRFEGVGQVADVFVNGVSVGTHKGAYSAFCFEITHALKFGDENLILVRVDNSPRPDIIPVNHRLFMVFGGIYRPVSLIVTDKIHITPTDHASPGIYIRQEDVSEKSARIFVRTKLENGHAVKKELTLKTTIRDAERKIIVSKQDIITIIPTVVTSVPQQLRISKPRLWNGRYDPYLYQLVVEVFDGDRRVDSVAQPLGIRYYTMDPDRGFILNGKPYRLYGVCRHQEWKDCGSALTWQQHKKDFDLIYEMGASSVRLAHYQQAESVYAYCDRLGLIIWAEIPFVNTYSGQEDDNAKQQILELVRQNFNHPSIFIWGLHNEVYARKKSNYPVQLTRELHDLVKTEDPDRWTVSVSGYGSLERAMDLHADLQGCNRYFGWYYGKTGDLDEWIKMTKEKRPDNFICVAEYGCGANVAHQSEDAKRANPISGQFFPEQYQTDMHEIQWAAIEKHPYIWGSYLWNMFDFSVPGWNRGGTKGLNHKGLITYDRSTKKDAFYFYKANWSKEPMVHIRDKRLTDRTQAQTQIKVYSNCEHLDMTVNGNRVELTSLGYATYSCEALLEEGENKIEVVAIHKGRELRDTCIWKLDTSVAKAKVLADANKTVIASSVESNHPSVPENTIDGEPDTYWSTDEENPWIRYTLGKERELGKIGIKWYKGPQRVYPFEIEFSFDGQVWLQTYNQANLIFVDTVIDGHKGLFLLDTGASHTIISEAFAAGRALNTVVRQAAVRGNMDTEKLNLIRIKSMALGEIEYSDFDVLVASLAHLKKVFGEFDGIIGSNVLNKTPYTLDYSGRKLVIGLPANLSKMVKIPVTIANNRPRLKLQINDKDVDFLLDSKATKSMISKSNYIGKTVEKEVDIEVNVNVKDQERKVDIYAKPEMVRLGGQVLKDIQFKIKDTEKPRNLLGANFLRQYVMAMDTETGVAYFQDALTYHQSASDEKMPVTNESQKELIP